jgi:hypothetical protein
MPLDAEESMSWVTEKTDVLGRWKRSMFWDAGKDRCSGTLEKIDVLGRWKRSMSWDAEKVDVLGCRKDRCPGLSD